MGRDDSRTIGRANGDETSMLLSRDVEALNNILITFSGARWIRCLFILSLLPGCSRLHLQLQHRGDIRLRSKMAPGRSADGGDQFVWQMACHLKPLISPLMQHEQGLCITPHPPTHPCCKWNYVLCFNNCWLTCKCVWAEQVRIGD